MTDEEKHASSRKVKKMKTLWVSSFRNQQSSHCSLKKLTGTSIS